MCADMNDAKAPEMNDEKFAIYTLNQIGYEVISKPLPDHVLKLKQICNEGLSSIPTYLHLQASIEQIEGSPCLGKIIDELYEQGILEEHKYVVDRITSHYSSEDLRKIVLEEFTEVKDLFTTLIAHSSSTEDYLSSLVGEYKVLFPTSSDDHYKHMWGMEWDSVKQDEAIAALGDWLYNDTPVPEDVMFTMMIVSGDMQDSMASTDLEVSLIVNTLQHLCITGVDVEPKTELKKDKVND